MEQSLNILVSTLVALFAVWLITHIIGKILYRIENFIRMRRFKKLMRSDKLTDVRVESYNSLGVPVCFSYEDPRSIQNDGKKRIVSFV